MCYNINGTGEYLVVIQESKDSNLLLRFLGVIPDFDNRQDELGELDISN